MSVRSCRVTVRDSEGVDHTVQVTASTLYEAVALGLVSLRLEEWVGAIPEGLNVVRVSVTNIPTEHSVKLQDFNAWLRKDGGTPREQTDRHRVRDILGLSAAGAE
jgi:hypothetical protein